MFGGLVPIDAVRSFDLPQGVNECIIAEARFQRIRLWKRGKPCCHQLTAAKRMTDARIIHESMIIVG